MQKSVSHTLLPILCFFPIILIGQITFIIDFLLVGQWGHWANWRHCSATCSTGTRQRHRSCQHQQRLATDCIGTDREEEPCSGDPCPVNASWGQWGPFGTCSNGCGKGTHSRSRTCSTPQHGGLSCSGSALDVQQCVSDTSCPSTT